MNFRVLSNKDLENSPENCFRIPIVPANYGHGRVWGGATSFFLSYFPDAPKDIVWGTPKDLTQRLLRNATFWENYLNRLSMCLCSPDESNEPNIIGILGIPMDSGVGYRSGARFGPRAIRAASAQFGSCTELGLDFSDKDNYKILDLGDVEIHPYAFDGKVLKSETLEEIDNSYRKSGDIPPLGEGNLERIYNAMKWILGIEVKSPKGKIVLPIFNKTANWERKVFPVIIGGDHSITPECVRALVDLYGKENFGVIYFDAHPDFLESRGGFKRSHATQAYEVSEIIGGNNILQIGTRYIEKEEKDNRESRGVKFLDGRTLAKMHTDEVVDEIKKMMPQNWKYIYISFDIDVLDAGIVPGTGVPEPGGLTPRFVIDIIQKFIKNTLVERGIKLVGIDAVEVAPDWDIGGIAALSAVKLIFETIGSYFSAKHK
jgi:agmatinase